MYDSFTFLSKVMDDLSIQYNYVHDTIIYDIEAAATDNKFAKRENTSAFITMIQVLHINGTDGSKKYLLMTL
jgi:hypothetical protein